MAGKPKMAMSSDFLDAFARLPRPQQRGVRSLISRFNADSTASGLNYERIHAARDPAMRSLRIDAFLRPGGLILLCCRRVPPVSCGTPGARLRTLVTPVSRLSLEIGQVLGLVHSLKWCQ